MSVARVGYLVDGNGKKLAVVLSPGQYRSLLQRIEDLEDALELDEAIRSEKSFRPYEKIRADLKKTGQL